MSNFKVGDMVIYNHTVDMMFCRPYQLPETWLSDYHNHSGIVKMCSELFIYVQFETGGSQFFSRRQRPVGVHPQSIKPLKFHYNQEVCFTWTDTSPHGPGMKYLDGQNGKILKAQYYGLPRDSCLVYQVRFDCGTRFFCREESLRAHSRVTVIMTRKTLSP